MKQNNRIRAKTYYHCNGAYFFHLLYFLAKQYYYWIQVLIIPEASKICVHKKRCVQILLHTAILMNSTHLYLNVHEMTRVGGAFFNDLIYVIHLCYKY